MNKTTRTQLHSLAKSDLVDYATMIIAHYNEVQAELDWLKGLISETFTRQGFPDNEQVD